MIILDTDMLSIIQREEGTAYQNLVAKLPRDWTDVVCVTIVSFEEQMRGWLAYGSRKRKTHEQIDFYAKLHNFLNHFARRKIVDFDPAAAEKFDVLRKKRLRIGTMDLKIAAVALVKNAKLITRNLSDFERVPDLIAEDWTK